MFIDINVEIKIKKYHVSVKAETPGKETIFDQGTKHVINFDIGNTPESVLSPEIPIRTYLQENIQYRDKDRVLSYKYDDQTGKVEPYVPSAMSNKIVDFPEKNGEQTPYNKISKKRKDKYKK